MRRLASFPLSATLPCPLRLLHGAAFVLFTLLTLLTIGGCAPARDPHAALLRQLDDGLARVETVQGLLDITQGPVTLNQEFWLQRPSFLRTETESGPGAFQGVIVALNHREGWVYSPALNLVTVVDRSNYTPVLAGEAGAGSSLERLPADVRRAVEAGYPIHKAGNETLAGRRTDQLGDQRAGGRCSSLRGHCMFGLTQNTPTRWPCVMPPAARFASDPSTSTQPSTHSSLSSSPALCWYSVEPGD